MFMKVPTNEARFSLGITFPVDIKPGNGEKQYLLDTSSMPLEYSTCMKNHLS